jgi:hypothetical protein
MVFLIYTTIHIVLIPRNKIIAGIFKNMKWIEKDREIK